ncbi:toll/interleukin-1 receptor domain-containing protein [Streptomyces sp. NPDC006265]|uniref:toll/interleukin-1 receptor domain-containing protein n=1 Tax=Streptomyces sp. NPDC006265 TaxID=3156740 RepID=UPI0033B1E9C4
MTVPLYAPVVEVYVVWHPADRQGKDIAEALLPHFRGDRFSGLLDGVVDVYERSAGLRGEGSAPRPIPFPGTPDAAAEYVVVVPLLGENWARAAEDTENPWHDYALRIKEAWNSRGPQPTLGVFPMLISGTPLLGRLEQLLGRIQRLAEPGRTQPEEIHATRLRDLSQGIAQLAHGKSAKLTVFISHTRLGDHAPRDIIDRVRYSIRDTRLEEWIDYHSLMPGSDSLQELRDRASDGIMLAVRTDEYASRHWCQREVLTAKRAGVPVVVLDALSAGDRRGSFLLDHVPRLCVGTPAGDATGQTIRRALNLLVDEYLNRVLWRSRRQALAAQPDLKVDWWASQPPEPATLTAWITEWLADSHRTGRAVADIRPRIVHPGPPLGEDEMQVLNEIASIGGIRRGLDITTVALLAARGA